MAIKERLLAVGLTAALASTGALVYNFEGEERVPYKDIVQVPTVCVGSTTNVIMSKIYTEAECTASFAKDLQAAESGVLRCTPNLPEGPRIAFTSFAFNVGTNAYCNSTLAKKALSGDFRGACAQLPRWVYAGKVVVPGLVKRRLAEQAVCYGT